jgi:hypothetical protein
MKKFILLLLLAMPLLVAAQHKADTSWKGGGVASLMFNQIALSNWAAGGQNSISGTIMVSLFANYHKNKLQWDNTLDMAYGLSKQGNLGIIKSDDKIDFSSKYGQYAFKHWYYTALLNFKTQFAQGFNYPNDSVMISDFMAPAYLTIALGMDYKPADYFSLFIAPVTGKITFVNNQTLANLGAFGVDKAVIDETTGDVITPGKKVRSEFGGYLKAAFKKDIMKNVTLGLKLDMFSNYLKKPQNIVINGEMIFAAKINKYISATLTTNVIYDDAIKIRFYDSDGNLTHEGPRTQLKEVFGLGFSYKF